MTGERIQRSWPCRARRSTAEGEREERRDVAEADGEQEVEREHQVVRLAGSATRSRRDSNAAAAIRSAQTPKT